MMKLFLKAAFKSLCLFFLAYAPLTFSAKQLALLSPEEAVKIQIEQGNYLGAFQKLKDLSAIYSESAFQTSYFDLLASLESFLGMYLEAIEDDDRAWINTHAVEPLSER